MTLYVPCKYMYAKHDNTSVHHTLVREVPARSERNPNRNPNPTDEDPRKDVHKVLFKISDGPRLTAWRMLVALIDSVTDAKQPSRHDVGLRLMDTSGVTITMRGHCGKEKEDDLGLGLSGNSNDLWDVKRDPVCEICHVWYESPQVDKAVERGGRHEAWDC